MVLTKQLTTYGRTSGQKAARTSGKAPAAGGTHHRIVAASGDAITRPGAPPHTYTKVPLPHQPSAGGHPCRADHGRASTACNQGSPCQVSRRYRTTVTAIAQLNQLHTDVDCRRPGLLISSPVLHRVTGSVKRCRHWFDRRPCWMFWFDEVC